MDDVNIPFDGMSEEEFLYRTMDVDGPMYMEPSSENHIFYECDEINVDVLADWD